MGVAPNVGAQSSSFAWPERPPVDTQLQYVCFYAFEKDKMAGEVSTPG